MTNTSFYIKTESEPCPEIKTVILKVFYVTSRLKIIITLVSMQNFN